ncbi:30S ribosomal protein S5 [Candidatus Babela massiliensis]|uniref:Small ribosomal subunit protein uS5 n=1 Tax=Candidatus Babela massiliensis TaxID=673862 RepID=V6DJ07_9BACT|nr:30S ribosomal protein S5 [Candidatus Babela massiliensis]CDK30496.1 Ribosomal protein S5 [Candidatus Babela massiliensis]
MAEKTKEYVDKVVSVNRVTKVTKGGKRFSFSAFVVSGDQQGRVGMGIGKSREVSSAIAKATAKARKSMIAISLRDTTVPYNVLGKHGASKVIICSAYKGTGVIAGGVMRKVMEVVGIKDVLAKSLGSTCGLNVVKATFNALSKCRSAEYLAKLRGKTVKQITKE